MSPQAALAYVLITILLSCLLPGCNRTKAPAATPPPWACAGGDAQNRGRGLGTPKLAKTRWTFDAHQHISTAAAIGEDGTVYITTSGSNLYAMNGKTGRKIWDKNFTPTPLQRILSHAANPPVWQTGHTPALGKNGLLYVLTDEGILYAYTARTGALRWRHRLEGTVGESHPIVGHDGTVYAATTGGWPSHLHAFDGDSGRLRWSIAPPSGTSGTGGFMASPALTDTGTIVVSSLIGVFGLDSANGTIQWAYTPLDAKKLRVGFITGPVIGRDHTVYVSPCDGGIHALDGTTGKRKWRYASRQGEQLYGDPVLGSDDTLYFTTNANCLYAIDRTGKERWRVARDGFLGRPAIGAAGTLYLTGCRNGAKPRTFSETIVAVDGQSGAILREMQISKEALEGGAGPPAIGRDGTLYIGTWEGKIWAIR